MSHATSLAVVRRPALDNPPPFDRERAERAVRELLLAVGENPDREGLLDTPGRVARAYQELFSGLREDAGGHLARDLLRDIALPLVVGANEGEADAPSPPAAQVTTAKRADTNTVDVEAKTKS